MGKVIYVALFIIMLSVTGYFAYTNYLSGKESANLRERVETIGELYRGIEVELDRATNSIVQLTNQLQQSGKRLVFVTNSITIAITNTIENKRIIDTAISNFDRQLDEYADTVLSIDELLTKITGRLSETN